MYRRVNGLTIEIGREKSAGAAPWGSLKNNFAFL
jgi:hypothetical protein